MIREPPSLLTAFIWVVLSIAVVVYLLCVS
jgi:hypothetical protein